MDPQGTSSSQMEKEHPVHVPNHLGRSYDLTISSYHLFVVDFLAGCGRGPPLLGVTIDSSQIPNICNVLMMTFKNSIFGTRNQKSDDFPWFSLYQSVEFSPYIDTKTSPSHRHFACCTSNKFMRSLEKCSERRDTFLGVSNLSCRQRLRSVCLWKNTYIMKATTQGSQTKPLFLFVATSDLGGSHASICLDPNEAPHPDEL